MSKKSVPMTTQAEQAAVTGRINEVREATRARLAAQPAEGEAAPPGTIVWTHNFKRDHAATVAVREAARAHASAARIDAGGGEPHGKPKS